MAEASAWVLNIGGDLRAAVGERELVHILDEFEAQDVPTAPHHCRQVILWQDEILPLMNLTTWLKGRTVQLVKPLVGVLAYQPHAGGPVGYGGVLLATMPSRTKVRDEQACELPRYEPGWRRLAISCFSDEQRSPIPILDIPTIFSDALVTS